MRIAFCQFAALYRNIFFRLLLFVVFSCCVSVLQGQDANWDLLNYHLYNPFSLMNGRFDIDFNAVGTQTFFNPILDLPYYLLSTTLMPDDPRMVTFIAGIPTGILIFIITELSFSLARCLPGNVMAGGSFAAVMGLSGTMLYSEIGTTFGDIPVAVLVLGGLIRPIRLLGQPAPPDAESWGRSAILAGILFGMAAGLKPMALIYAPAGFIALIMRPTGRRHRLYGALGFCAGWAAAFAIIYGWWGIKLYTLFGNPLFPLLNDHFPSLWVPAIPATDDRFLPHGLMQTFFYPFYWLRAHPNIISETGIRDAHFALAHVSALAMAIALFLQQLLPDGLSARVKTVILNPGVLFVYLFFVISFCVWEALFSILRYAITLEVLTGIMVYIGTHLAAACFPGAMFSTRRFHAVLCLLLIATIATANRPGWGRLRHFGRSVFDIGVPSVKDGTLVVLADKPLGFILPFLKGSDLSFVGLVDLPPPGYGLWNEAQKRIDASRPVSVLISGTAETYSDQLAMFGLLIDPNHCAPIENDFRREIRICGATHAKRPAMAGNGR